MPSPVPAVPQPQPQSQAHLAPIAYFVGAWTADAKNPATGQAFTLSYTITPSVDGAWLDGAGRAEELGITVSDRWGIDGPTGDIVRVMFDSSGLWGVVRSKGWDGDRLVLEGDANAPGDGGVVRVRETITKVSATEFGAVWESLADGAWTVYSIERLTR
ncbi:MAG TPA: hypothetical protein VM261_28780 [Kofleriaceae bacterium]|nr:hypothetical protein [Kofleriaceae bacterium]